MTYIVETAYKDSCGNMDYYRGSSYHYIDADSTQDAVDYVRTFIDKHEDIVQVSRICKNWR